MKIEQDLRDINYCILIPTFNNDKTLENVILETLKYTPDIIVINDGSNDHTENILKRYQNKIEVVSYPHNQGKGAAIRKGLKRAEELGYQYAITLDSDGQHLPSEIPKLLEKLPVGKDILIIGDREMTDVNIPKKSLFGRKFSNFWVKLETGQNLSDTQSGFRLYTVSKINQFRFFTKKYDFEIESLVRWLWRGYPVETVSIQVYYPPPEERVSHFRTFKDNYRISLLNIVLLIVTFFLVIPRRLWRMISKGIKKLFV